MERQLPRSSQRGRVSARGMQNASEARRLGDRIVVVGTTGSGKTTTARMLADRLGVPYVELDALFWRPEWAETPDEEFFRRVNEATQGDGWVVDGNYSRTRPVVWARADTIIWLDYCFVRVFWQLLRRSLRRSIRREELWEGCRESLGRQFLSRDSILLWCIKTYRRRRRTYSELLRRADWAHLAYHRFRSPRALCHWLDTAVPARGGERSSSTDVV
jgi:adenylate kinase family enzyme